MVNPDDSDHQPVSRLDIPEEGLTVPVKKYGFVRVFHTLNKEGKNTVSGDEYLDHGSQGQNHSFGNVSDHLKLSSCSQGIMLCRRL